MKNFAARHPITSISTLLALLIIGIIIRAVYFGSEVMVQEEPQPKVSLVEAKVFKNGLGEIVGVGVVESSEQVEIRSQASAQISGVYVKIGQNVSRGETIATLQNSDLLAQLAQAEALAKSQEARLSEVRKGARSETLALKEIELNKARLDLDNIYENTLNALSDAYAKTEEVSRKQLDDLFINDNTDNPELSFNTINSSAKYISLQKRVEISGDILDWKNDLQKISGAGMRDEIENLLIFSIKSLGMHRSMLDGLSDAVNTAPALDTSALAGYRSLISGARSTVNGTISSLNLAKQGIESQKINIQRIGDELDLLKSGATDDQIVAQEALYEQSLASVRAIKAQLEKTRIIAPISGKISILPIRTGDLVTFGQIVSAIVNTNGLKVKTSVSGRDLSLLKIGDEALVKGGVSAVVSSIAPSVDVSSRKALVEVVVAQDEAKLIVGEFVDIKIKTPEDGSHGSLYYLPLDMVRITPNGNFVYVVNDDLEVEELAVDLGEVNGETVEILGGLKDDTRLIKSARGIRVGDRVTIE